MRGKTQSVHLAKMMQRHKYYPEYELVLPFLLVKRKSLKKLSKGNVLLLGDDSLNLKLLKDDLFCGNVMIEESTNSRVVKIMDIEEYTASTTDSKKYKLLKGSFSFLQSRIFEIGHKIDISSIDLEKVNLFLDNKKVAEGTLVNVDEEIAIEITKVDL